MKRKILFVGFLLISLLIITGCGSGKQTKTQIGAFIGGTQGVIAEFEPFGLEEDGVYSIFDSDTFQIETTLKNKGEYELQPRDVTIKLLGPSPEEFSGIASWELKNQGTIDKISELVEQGGEETITFASDAKYNGEVKGILERKWFANLEYKYQTQLIIPEVCLKEDLRDERVCEVKGVKTFFVSGAPITVTKVEEDTAGKGLAALKIMVKNVAGGEVTKIGEEFGISDNIAFALDDPAWECKASGKINEARLLNGETEIFCKLKEPLAEGTLSTKQVKLTIDYMYRDLIQEGLQLKASVK